MKRLTKLILDDMQPALGVTEPAAIAFAVAKARQYVSGQLKGITLTLNSGMYKNAFTCGIPHTKYVGNEYAAALGYVAADAEKGLECLDAATAADSRKAKEIVERRMIHVISGEVSSKIYIRAEIVTDEGNASVTIRDRHTNICEITRGSEVVFRKEASLQAEGVKGSDDISVIHRYTLRQIVNYVRNVPMEEIRFISRAYDVNLRLFRQALRSGKTPFAHYLYLQNGSQIISSDEQKSASLLCNASIEARVIGLSQPAMSITGSGAHGIIATLPLYASQQVNGYDEDSLLRATALSYLVCMYIKEYSGRLSAFCGCAIAAGTGMACGLAYLKGAGVQTLALVIRNMASGITGMICDGGNHGCTMKGIVAVDAAFRAVDFALQGIAIESLHGINGNTPEDTMRNMGLIASPGMTTTEVTVLDIMKNKTK